MGLGVCGFFLRSDSACSPLAVDPTDCNSARPLCRWFGYLQFGAPVLAVDPAFSNSARPLSSLVQLFSIRRAYSSPLIRLIVIRHLFLICLLVARLLSTASVICLWGDFFVGVYVCYVRGDVTLFVHHSGWDGLRRRLFLSSSGPHSHFLFVIPLRRSSSCCFSFSGMLDS